MSEPSLPSWWRVTGITLVAVTLVIALEGAILLTPAPVGLGVALVALLAGVVALRSPRTAALRRLVRLDRPAPAAGRLLPGMALVACFVLASLLLLQEATKTIDIPLLTEILGDRSLVNRLRLVSVIVLAGPIGEELALRGWLQSQLERRWSTLASVLVTALVFGLMHGVDVRLGYFVTLGAMFGAAVVAFRSLWVAIVLHMSVNAMGAIPLLVGQGSARPPAEVALQPPSPWWGVLAASLILVLYARWLHRALARGAP